METKNKKNKQKQNKTKNQNKAKQYSRTQHVTSTPLHKTEVIYSITANFPEHFGCVSNSSQVFQKKIF